jgi:hypothetical protein
MVTAVEYYGFSFMFMVVFIGLIYKTVNTFVDLADYSHYTRYISENEDSSSSDEDAAVDEANDSEQSMDSDGSDRPNVIEPTELVEVPYRHELWPSPRPSNFVRALIQHDPDFNPNRRRLNHATAVDILANRAFMTRKEFLKMNPITYMDKFMKDISVYDLLKDDLERLEQLLQKEAYTQQLYVIENGNIRLRR